MSADPFYLEYAGEIPVRRYSRRSIIIFVAGAFAGPLIAAPIMCTLYLSSAASEFTRNFAFILALLLSMYFAVIIPIYAFREKKRLRNTSGIRGKKLVRGGLILYGLWLAIPAASALIILAINLILIVFRSLPASPTP